MRESRAWTTRIWHLVAVAAVFLATLAAVGVAGFYAVLILVGPHGGLLPDAFYIPVLALFWLSVVGLPVGLAWFTRRRLIRGSRRAVADPTGPTSRTW